MKAGLNDWNCVAWISNPNTCLSTLRSVNRFIELPACSKNAQNTTDTAVRNNTTSMRSRSIGCRRKHRETDDADDGHGGGDQQQIADELVRLHQLPRDDDADEARAINHPFARQPAATTSVSRFASVGNPASPNRCCRVRT